jgi:hypothetical protein
MAVRENTAAVRGEKLEGEKGLADQRGGLDLICQFRPANLKRDDVVHLGRARVSARDAYDALGNGC